MSVLASGTYRYFRDGAVQSIVEPWAMVRSNSGHVLKGERTVAGRCILRVEADYEKGLCRSLRVDWQPDSPVKARTLHYHHHDTALEWGLLGEPTVMLPLPPGSELFPLLRAAAGPLICRLAGGANYVALPSLRVAEDSAGFLNPILSRRHAILQPGADGADRHYRYLGGEYGEAGSDYWLNDKDLVTRYRWQAPDGLWEVSLN